MLVWVNEERSKHPLMGARKLFFKLQERLAEAGISFGRDRFFRLLRQAGLLLPRRVRNACRTTDSRHGFRRYDNLLKGLSLTAAHQALVTDITYIRTLEGFRYLSLVTDAYSRKIVGYDLSASLTVEGSLRALTMAIKQLPCTLGVLHHSDRGVQYCSHAYTGLLREGGMRISMTSDVYENAIAERLNGILKEEYSLSMTFISEQQARRAVDEAVFLYNDDRPHTSLGYLTPSQVHEGVVRDYARAA